MWTRDEFRKVRWGVDALPARVPIPRHRHFEGYANIILSGSFTEASFAGRFRVQAGEVLLHGGFDCHSNTNVCQHGLTILRLPWRREAVEGHLRVRDPDILVRLAERDPWEAMLALELSLEQGPVEQPDWPALLAADLAADPTLRLKDWAAAHALRVETVSRGFQRTFGVTPKLYRLEMRARQAWREIVGSPHSLTGIAHTHGFSDLAHMSRSVRHFTGRSPSAWRSHSAVLGPQLDLQ